MILHVLEPSKHCVCCTVVHVAALGSAEGCAFFAPTSRRYVRLQRRRVCSTCVENEKVSLLHWHYKKYTVLYSKGAWTTITLIVPTRSESDSDTGRTNPNHTYMKSCNVRGICLNFVAGVPREDLIYRFVLSSATIFR